MKNGAVRIVANYKDHTSGNYKKSVFHMPSVSDPFDHCTAVRYPFKLARVIHSCTVEGYSISACMAMLLSNYPRVKVFIYFATFQSASFVILVSNVVNLWSMEGNGVSKCR